MSAIDERVEEILTARHRPGEWEYISTHYPLTAELRRFPVRMRLLEDRPAVAVSDREFAWGQTRATLGPMTEAQEEEAQCLFNAGWDAARTETRA